MAASILPEDVDKCLRADLLLVFSKQCETVPDIDREPTSACLLAYAFGTPGILSILALIHFKMYTRTLLHIC
jgi:hypothetical protein